MNNVAEQINRETRSRVGAAVGYAVGDGAAPLNVASEVGREVMVAVADEFQRGAWSEITQELYE